MATSVPDLSRPGPESFDRLGIFFPAGDEPSAPPLKASGPCSVAGCHCPGFVGKDEICETCGHKFVYHW
jgi:hypothetical protein